MRDLMAGLTPPLEEIFLPGIKEEAEVEDT